ncbi:MAG: TlpA family protein disulfide reductase [Elusimicrobia bacterium]|nr:TlpA family protein disulfide reductase [Elusimicrobiota bacterium]
MARSNTSSSASTPRPTSRRPSTNWSTRLFACALLALAACRPAPEAGKAGPPAADFALKDLSGKTVRLGDFKGKVLLLDFWATYCGPCEESVPALDRLYREFKGSGLEVVGVSVDTFADAVPDYVKEHRMTYTVLLDEDEKAREAYKLRGLPQAFLIDREGRVLTQWFGYDQTVHEGMEKAVREALKAG